MTMVRHRNRHHRRPSPHRTFLIALIGALGGVLAVYIALLAADLHARSSSASFAGLSDQQGRLLTDSALGDRYKLLFFGYAQCPDVCPTALARIHAVMNMLGPGGSRLTPLFVTLDAAADSPQVLAGYTAAFDSRIVGLSGDSQHLDALTRAYGVYAARHADSNDIARFDHSAQIYLLAPDNSLLALYPPNEATEPMAADVSRRLKAWSR
jgi:protein SCO1